MRRKLDTLLSRPASFTNRHERPQRLTHSTAYASLQDTLGIFQEVAGQTGIPGLQEGVKSLTILLDAVQVRFISDVFINQLTILVRRKHLEISTT